MFIVRFCIFVSISTWVGPPNAEKHIVGRLCEWRERRTKAENGFEVTWQRSCLSKAMSISMSKKKKKNVGPRFSLCKFHVLMWHFCGFHLVWVRRTKEPQMRPQNFSRTSHASCFISRPKGRNRGPEETSKPLTELQNGSQPFGKRMKQTGLLFYIVPHLAATACSKTGSIIWIKGVTEEGKKHAEFLWFWSLLSKTASTRILG